MRNARLAIRLGRAAGRAYQRYRSSTNAQRDRKVMSNRTQKKSVSLNPLTEQTDYRITYRKGRMPRGKKRRYVKSLRRWKSAQLRLQPSRIFQNLFAQQYEIPQNRCLFTAAFMGLYANNHYDNCISNSLSTIGAANVQNKIIAGGVRLDHQSLRVVIRNLSVLDNERSSTTVDVDVYQVICIKDVPIALWPTAMDFDTFFHNLQDQHRQAAGMDVEVNSAGAGLPTAPQNFGSQVGNSVFNNPAFLSYFKVVKAFKVQLAQNNITEFQIRSSRNKYIKNSEVLSDFPVPNLAAKAWVTQGYVFNYNGRAFPTGSNEIAFNSGLMVEEHYVRYNLKMVPGGAPTLNYDGTA